MLKKRKKLRSFVKKREYELHLLLLQEWGSKEDRVDPIVPKFTFSVLSEIEGSSLCATDENQKAEK